MGKRDAAVPRRRRGKRILCVPNHDCHVWDAAKNLVNENGRENNI